MALNMIFVNDTGLPDDQVFITFQDPSGSLSATYKTVTKTVKGTITDTNNVTRGTSTVNKKTVPDIMTDSLSLEEIGPDGLTLDNANGVVVFVSYEATKANGGFVMGADLSGNKQPSYIGSGGANYHKAFQPFEITCVNGSTSGQGNLTNINYFCAPISIQSYNGGKDGTLLQTRGYYGGTATGTDTLNTKLAAVVKGANSDLATITYEGKILRYIGPSSFGAGTSPYPSFDDYLTWLNTQKQVTKIQNHNAFVASDGTNYDYALDFTATVASDYTITLAGDIVATITPKSGSSTTKTYSGASMIISPTVTTNTPKTSAAIFNNTIYGQADPETAGNGSTYYNDVWTQLSKDMTAAGLVSTAYATTQGLAIGEITTGLLGGFVGSSYAYNGGSQTYADMPSEDWWDANTIPSPSVLQPNNAYYSEYSEIIFDATDNQVYSIPYSDRFGSGPLIQTQLYDKKTVDTWVVTLGKPIFMV